MKQPAYRPTVKDARRIRSALERMEDRALNENQGYLDDEYMREALDTIVGIVNEWDQERPTLKTGDVVWWLHSPGGGKPKARRRAVVQRVLSRCVEIYVVDRGPRCAFSVTKVRNENIAPLSPEEIARA